MVKFIKLKDLGKSSPLGFNTKNCLGDRDLMIVGNLPGGRGWLQLQSTDILMYEFTVSCGQSLSDHMQ